MFTRCWLWILGFLKNIMKNRLALLVTIALHNFHQFIKPYGQLLFHNSYVTTQAYTQTGYFFFVITYSEGSHA